MPELFNGQNLPTRYPLPPPVPRLELVVPDDVSASEVFLLHSVEHLQQKILLGAPLELGINKVFGRI